MKGARDGDDDDTNVENFAKTVRRNYQWQCENERKLRLYRRNGGSWALVSERVYSTRLLL
ncbi:hypothetical protein Csa_009852 [Cucumis sativus]|uniref:Uncharacterized protein n=1 Tax=Cucumis sativus TaxID=3659 RepID=A0A0A0LB35_CUCSA|nr:hypothetical protein Csa_009852 [Cucumis sativus]